MFTRHLTTTTTPAAMTSMFYDPRFDPAGYLDQLFVQLVGDTANPDVYKRLAGDPSAPTMATVNNLISEMEFMTQELVHQPHLAKLQEAGILLNDKTTRLQYYAQVVNNAIVALEQELHDVRDEITRNHEPSETVAQLSQLSKAKANLQQVLEVCEQLYRTMGQTSLTPAQMAQLLKEKPDEKAKVKPLVDGLTKFKNI